MIVNYLNKNINMKFKSFISNFFKGMGSIFNIVGNYNTYEDMDINSSDIFKSDKDALISDWNAVVSDWNKIYKNKKGV